MSTDHTAGAESLSLTVLAQIHDLTATRSSKPSTARGEGAGIEDQLAKMERDNESPLRLVSGTARRHELEATTAASG